jgi:pyochelin biosynthetic protein PchC
MPELSSRARSRWFRTLHSPSRGRARLVCVPPAGAGATYFRSWVESVDPDIAILAVQLPGREDRIREKQDGPLGDWIRAMAKELVNLPPARWVLFGHSFGALVAYELARCLEEGGQPPALVGLSGAPPDVVPRGELTPVDDESLTTLLRQAGADPRLLDHPGARDVLVSTFRGDLAIARRHRLEAHPRLGAEVMVFGGLEDPLTRASGLGRWERLCERFLGITMFHAGHNYGPAEKRAICRILSDAVADEELQDEVTQADVLR